jgi:hypothetical protein
MRRQAQVRSLCVCVCVCVCVCNTEHACNSAKLQLQVWVMCVYNRECVASIISFSFAETHTYFVRVLVSFSQETCVIMDCISQVTALHEPQLVWLPFLHTSSYGCMWLSLDSLATISFITYLFGDTERAVQFIIDFTTFMHVKQASIHSKRAKVSHLGLSYCKHNSDTWFIIPTVQGQR